MPENTNEKVNSGILAQWIWQSITLYHEIDFSKPVWFEHPKHGSNFDVVAIPLKVSGKSLIKAANTEIHNLDNFEVYPSMDAFVLGYPFGSGGGNFPIWKRATIATEPDIDIDGMPKLFIDTATREGMSGAPVFAQEVGYWQTKGVTDLGKAHLGKGRKFLGVYSGRIGAENAFKSQLGVVWKEQALIELLKNVPAQSD